MASRYRDLVKQGSPLLLAMVLASLAVYGFHFFASRRLGVEDYGVLASLLATVTLVSSASQIGATIAARFAAEFDAVQDWGRLRRLFDLTASVCALLVVTGVASAVLFRVPLAAFFHLSSPWPIVLTAVVAGLVLSGNVLRGLMQGSQQFVRFSFSFIIENVGRALLGSIAVALGYGIGGAFVAQIGAGAAAIAYTYLRILSGFRVKAERLRIDARRLIVTSGAIALATACLAMLSYFDIILAKHYLNDHDAGLYGFGTLPGRTLAAITAFLPTLILPKATAGAAAQRKGHGILYAGLGIAFAFTVVALAAFYLLRHWIVITAGGEQYAQAVPLLFPYGCAAGAFGLTRIAVSYNIGAHRLRFVPGLAIVVVLEIIGIVLFHRNPAQIVLVVLGANVMALAVALLPGSTALHRTVQPTD